MEPEKSAAKSSIPQKQRNKRYYELDLTKIGLPPGTDSYNQLVDNPRLPRPPATPKRPLPSTPPESERKDQWIAEYFDKLDPETEYDQIVRIHTFFNGTDFTTALGYAAVFCWLNLTPAGANAIHGNKIIYRGHQRYYETQLYNLHWVRWGSGSEETKRYIEQINKIHAGIWSKTPGAFSFPWEAQAAIILLSWYESYMRRLVGANRDIHPHLKEAWPEWGERLTAHFRSEPSNGSMSFGVNYPRNWDELDRFAKWFIAADFEDQRTEEDVRKGHETSEAFIKQFNELWFPRPLHWFGRAVLLTFIPQSIRRRHRLREPSPLLEWIVQKAFKYAFDYKDSQPDPVTAPLEEFYGKLQTWDMNKIDAMETANRDEQTRRFNVVVTVFGLLVMGALAYHLGIL